MIACGARSAAERCNGDCDATTTCALVRITPLLTFDPLVVINWYFGGHLQKLQERNRVVDSCLQGSQSLLALEEERQNRCQSTGLSWQPNTSTGTCDRVAPATAAAPAPEAIDYSAAERILEKSCGSDTCAPGICDVTVCPPDALGTCSSSAADTDTIHVLSDSPGTACCVSLPYNSRPPSTQDVLDGNLPAGVEGAQRRCAAMQEARQWQQMDFAALPSSQMFMVRCCRPVALESRVLNALNQRIH